jgi:hypothetical protein
MNYLNLIKKKLKKLNKNEKFNNPINLNLISYKINKKKNPCIIASNASRD